MSRTDVPLVRSGLIPVAERDGAELGEQDGWQVPTAYTELGTEVAAAEQRVAIVDLSAIGKLLIQGSALEDELAAEFGSSPATPTELIRFEGGWLTRINRFEHYAVLPLDRLARTTDALRTALSGQHASVTSLTHGTDALGLLGPAAPRTLTKLCGLDVRERSFPNRRVQISSLARVKAMIARLDQGELPCYEVHVDRTYSEYVWETVMDAAQEFGGRAIGTIAFHQLSPEEERT